MSSPPRFLPDTSCLVALVCSWHESHADVACEMGLRLARGEECVVAAPSLVETYAVLTRLPPPHRLSPDDALALLQANVIEGHARPVALSGQGYAVLLGLLPELRVAGGRAYDAVIAACARAAKVRTLLTLNGRDFLPLSGDDLAILDLRHKAAR